MTTLAESIEWARGQADKWRNQGPEAEPARSYMFQHYDNLANAAEKQLKADMAEQRAAAVKWLLEQPIGCAEVRTLLELLGEK